VFYLEELGLADGIISVVYVFLLGGIGLMITRESLASDGGGGIDHDAAAAEDLSEYEIPDIAKKIQQTVRIPPMVTLRGDIRVSVWVITAVAFSTGILSGFLGVGGRVHQDAGDDLRDRRPHAGRRRNRPLRDRVLRRDRELPVRAERRRGSRYRRPASVGGALGARIGSAATAVVDADDIKVYFGGMLLAGSVAVGIGEIGTYLGNETLETLGLVLVIGAAVVVAAAIVFTASVAPGDS